MSKQWIEETENLIHSIEKEYQAIADEHQKLGRELEAKEAELTHWKAALQSYQNRQAVPQPSLFLQGISNKDSLTHKEILLLVRDQNDGFIPMRQVTDIFKGKVANPDHAASAAYSTLKRVLKQGKVTKVRAGLYRWVNGAK